MNHNNEQVVLERICQDLKEWLRSNCQVPYEAMADRVTSIILAAPRIFYDQIAITDYKRDQPRQYLLINFGLYRPANPQGYIGQLEVTWANRQFSCRVFRYSLR